MIEDWLASFEDLTLIFKEIETAPCAGSPNPLKFERFGHPYAMTAYAW